ncbi:MAG: pyridoxal-phosphate dependent enzyme [Firmicutes bacterium]|jgi:threonine dehydratase|nr:pyridoxal-phosphate dependent enzyme [Bacillota bacterium]
MTESRSETLTLQSLRQARIRLQNRIRTTPLIASRSISDVTEANVRLKAEHLQRTGSFKIRGAFNRLLTFDRTRVQGVVAASSGNHGQAVAYAARALGLQATIILPHGANRLKVRSTQDFGARIEYAGTTSADRLARALTLADDLHPLVAPYDDYAVMAGQGTIGLEILEQWPEVEVVLVPIGGGGLISGIATAIKSSAPHVRVIGVEPEGAAKVSASLAAGHRVTLESTISVADGLKALTPGELTWPLIERLVDAVVTVSDQAIVEATRLLAERTKQVVEPSGATALAYALAPDHPLQGLNVVAVLSGGNIDWSSLLSALGE